MDISVIVPLYNEDESLPELEAWIERVMKANNFSYEIIFVNDGSTDKSWQVIQGLQKKNPWVNKKISDLDISRHSIIVLIQRKDKVLIPNGDIVLHEGDNVFLYTQLHLDTVSEIDL